MPSENDLTDTIRRLSACFADTRSLAQGAMDVLYEATMIDRGSVLRAVRGDYARCLRLLQRRMRAATETHRWPSNALDLRAMLESATPPPRVSGLSLAKACLVALDREAIAALRFDFSTRSRFRLEPGELFVAPDPDWKGRLLQGESLSNNPVHQLEPFETARLRRYPGDPDAFQVIWDTTQLVALTALLRGRPRMSSASPVDETCPRRNPNRGFAPARRSGASANANRILDAASAAGVAALVLPELSLDDAEVVHKKLQTLRHRGLIVPGSTAVPDPSHPKRYWNRTSLWLGGSRLLTYDKIHPMKAGAQPWVDAPDPAISWAGCEVDDFQVAGQAPAEATDRPENCTPGNALTLLWSPQWVVAVVICADLFLPSMRSALANSRANLILVPMLTPKIGNFHSRFQELAEWNQAVIVTSNSIHPDAAAERATSAFYTPVKPDASWNDDSSGYIREHSWT